MNIPIKDHNLINSIIIFLRIIILLITNSDPLLLRLWEFLKIYIYTLNHSMSRII